MKTILKKSIFLLLALFSIKVATAQNKYAVSVPSSLGYKVEIAVTPNNIITSGSCTYGYNYNVGINYEVAIITTGEPVPANLYTLQGNLGCGSATDNFFTLPIAGGSGSGATMGSSWNPNPDCLYATPASLNCKIITIEIGGPGIPHQFINAPLFMPLPVSVISFNVENKTKREVELTWTTASELNNAYFVVEHSMDAVNWDSISTVKGAGSSSKIIAYKFIDHAYTDGVNYYRLKSVDYNGTTHYLPTKLVNVNSGLNSNTISIFPNPALDNITIKGSTAELRKVEFYNSQGKSMFTVESQLSNEKYVSIELSKLPEGVYFVKTQNNIQKLTIAPRTY